jgi:hypothetical protein
MPDGFPVRHFCIWKEEKNQRRKIMTRNLALLLVLSFFVASCSTFVPAPTPTPTQTATPVPTETPVPTATSTSTPKPTLTATLDVISALLPSGTPVSEWNGVPIMPGAIAGEVGAEGYTFSIQADTKTIQEFYEWELAKQGFALFITGEGDEKNIQLLMFMKGSEFVTISIMPVDDLMIVLILG